jgi:isocitrate/isopropylmalate dehydrogenase
MRMTNKHQSSRVEATLIPGDGIGPEIVAAVQIVLDALGSPFVWDISCRSRARHGRSDHRLVHVVD